MRQTITLMIALTALLLPAAALAARERVEVLQNQLEHPWALAFLPDDRGILMTLRGGELRLWQRDKGLAPAISGVPQVWANGQGGLLDVALAPDFAQSRRVWLSYAEGGDRRRLRPTERGSPAPGKLPGGFPPAAEALNRQPFWRAAGVRRPRLFVYRSRGE